jgi:UDP-N-acetylglucosamine transferase subunit ALG13
MLKIIETPNIAMQHMRTYVKEGYQQSLMCYRDERRGNMVDKHQAHLAATLVKETSKYILNTSPTNYLQLKTIFYLSHLLCQNQTLDQNVN